MIEKEECRRMAKQLCSDMIDSYCDVLYKDQKSFDETEMIPSLSFFVGDQLAKLMYEILINKDDV